MMTNKLSQEEIRQVQMSILDEIVRICEENHLRYYLAYGSLLGAVRHKGYIPWDDDMDIAMQREDYETLLAILKRKDKSHSEWISVIDDTADDYFYPFAKAIDNRTEIKSDRHKGYQGIWIDIFPIDGLPKTLFEAKAFIFFCSFLRIVGLAMSTDFSSKTLSSWALFYKRIFNFLATIIGKKRVCRFVERVFHRYRIENSERVAILFSGHNFDAIFNKTDLLPQATYSFEGKNYTSFKNFDLYLRQLYGNYRELPPEEKRRSHNFEAWRK